MNEKTKKILSYAICFIMITVLSMSGYSKEVKAEYIKEYIAESSVSNSVLHSEPLVITNAKNLGDSTCKMVGEQYNVSLLSSGGISSKFYSLKSGTLPYGLKLSPDGILSGTFTSAGTFDFEIKVTDSLG